MSLEVIACGVMVTNHFSLSRIKPNHDICVNFYWNACGISYVRCVIEVFFLLQEKKIFARFAIVCSSCSVFLLVPGNLEEAELNWFHPSFYVNSKSTYLRMMCYSVMTQAYSEKQIPSSPNRSRTNDLPITSSEAPPLSYRRLVGAKAIKLGSWDKHPAYC